MVLNAGLIPPSDDRFVGIAILAHKNMSDQILDLNQVASNIQWSIERMKSAEIRALQWLDWDTWICPDMLYQVYLPGVDVCSSTCCVCSRMGYSNKPY